MKLAMIGTGYVGLVAGVCFADAGHQTTCVDQDENKIAALKKGHVPIYEPGLEEILEQAIKKKRISFTTDLKEAVAQNKVIFVAVGTPEGTKGEPDMSQVMGVVKTIADNAKEEKFVVLKSTVPIGTSKLIENYFLEHSKFQIHVINNPEFLKEGAAIEDFLRPDRVVIGCKSDIAREAMGELYEPFLKNGHPIYFMDNTSAELTKYAANAFLSVKISFINELARLSDEVGADINEVRRGFTSDKRINPAFFYPGIGYGGSCFPKDVKALVHTGHRFGVEMSIVEAAERVNASQRAHMFSKIKTHFNGSLSGRVIALWGLSFKPRTDDVREAPALALIDMLVEAGAKVRAYDPVAMENAKKLSATPFELGKDPMSILDGADALAVITEWNEFRNPNLDDVKKSMRTPVIFDGRNIFDPIKMKKHEFSYYCFGRQTLAENKKAKT